MRYPIKVTVCLLWMLQLGLGCTPEMGRVTASAAYLHMIINATWIRFSFISELESFADSADCADCVSLELDSKNIIICLLSTNRHERKTLKQPS